MTRISWLMSLLSVCILGCSGPQNGVSDDSAAMSSPSLDGSPKSVPTYSVDHTWPPTLPNDWILGVPTSVSVDKDDHVWVLHRPRTVSEDERHLAAPAVVEFDRNGTFVQAWGGPSPEYDWPDTEHGIFVDHENNVWITGINPRAGGTVSNRSDDMLLKFDKTGTLLFQLGGYDASGGNSDLKNPRQPADISVYAATEEVFIADGYGNRRIWVLDSNDGSYKRHWGAYGDSPIDAYPIGQARPEPSSVSQPNDSESPPKQWGIVHGIGVSSDGLVYVADRGNKRIQVFTTNGEYLKESFVNQGGESASTVARIVFSADSEQRLIFAND